MTKLSSGTKLSISGTIYEVQTHPAARNISFAQEGAKGTVYQLKHKNDQKFYALKVFKELYRTPSIVRQTDELAAFAHWPGMSVCKRDVIKPTGKNAKLVQQYPDFEYAVLMPWMEGRTWFDIVAQRVPIAPRVALEIARRTATVFQHLEANGCAHSDPSSGNILIEVDTLNINLIDVEDMYAPHFPKPSTVPHGTSGYNHRQARQQGQWCAEGDRFAVAVLLAEMICWHDPQVRQAATEEGTYFDAREMHDPHSDRYHLLMDVLAEIDYLPETAREELVCLFEQAWDSDRLEECPTIQSWLDVLKQVPVLPAGMRLTDGDIPWPVRYFKPIPIPESPTIPFNPVIGFNQPVNPSMSLKVPRWIPHLHDGSTHVRLQWLSVEQAEKYEVAQHRLSDCSDAPISVTSADYNEVQLICDKGEWFFRVRAVNGGVVSGWSQTHRVVVYRFS